MMRKILILSILFFVLVFSAQPSTSQQSSKPSSAKTIWEIIPKMPTYIADMIWEETKAMIKFLYLPYHDSVMCTLCKQGIDEYVLATSLALTASAILLALLYMVGQALGHGTIQAWTKVELGELIISAFFFAFLSGFLILVCNLSVTTIFPSLDNPYLDHNYTKMNIFEASNALLYEFAASAETLLVVQFVVGKFLTWTCGMTLHGMPVGMGTHGSVLQGFLSIVNAMLQITMITTGISIITALGQMHVLNFAQVLFIRYLLPIGFVARCFSPTRRFGGALIAIAITFIFIYPFLVVMSYQIYEVTEMPFTTMLKVWVNYFTGQGGDGLKLWQKISDSNDPGVILGFGLLSAFVSLLTVTFIPPTATIFIGGVFIPLLLTVVVITGVRHLSRMIGEEVDITNLTRMI